MMEKKKQKRGKKWKKEGSSVNKREAEVKR